MSIISITADTADARKGATDARRAAEAGVRSLAERGVVIVKDEVPYERLKKDVTVEDNTRGLPYGKITAKVTMSAIRPAEAPTTGTMHLPSGVTREVKVRGTKEFDVAKAVWEGTGMFGPRGTIITPRRAKMLLIEVPSVPLGQSYITARNKTFVVRPESAGMKPDDFPQRAFQRLDGEAANIMEDALRRAGVIQ